MKSPMEFSYFITNADAIIRQWTLTSYYLVTHTAEMSNHYISGFSTQKKGAWIKESIKTSTKQLMFPDLKTVKTHTHTKKEKKDFKRKIHPSVFSSIHNYHPARIKYQIVSLKFLLNYIKLHFHFIFVYPQMTFGNFLAI